MERYIQKHVQIKNSYNVWSPKRMVSIIRDTAGFMPGGHKLPLIIEWWLHNICYWLTIAFIFIPAIKKINLRAKDVDLMITEEQKK